MNTYKVCFTETIYCEREMIAENETEIKKRLKGSRYNIENIVLEKENIHYKEYHIVDGTPEFV
jgi:hypothetical protein